MRNWKSDGWTERDWDNITEDSKGLSAIAGEFDAAVGGGGGGVDPAHLGEFAERLQSMADRLKRISSAYL